MADETADDDGGFREVYDLLDRLVAAIERVRSSHATVVSGPELITLVAIQGDERNLDHDVHRLERQLRAHQAS